MTRETLYDAITEIRDELVIEARETVPARQKGRWLKFGSIAAAVAIVVALGAGTLTGRFFRLPIGGNSSGPGSISGSDSGPGSSSGSDGGSTFMSYAGPVFPLTTVEGGDGLTAEREITFDFKAWENGTWPYTSLPVTDSCTLSNPAGEDKTVTLLYPFVSSLYDLPECRPALTADGAELDTALLAGGYAGGFQGAGPDDASESLNLRQYSSWEQYRDLLADGSYQASALGGWPDLSGVPVTVYEITDPWVAEDAGGTNPTIHAAFGLDYDSTTVLTCGFHGASMDRDEGAMRHSFSAPQYSPSLDPDYYKREQDRLHYLIIIGEPVTDFQLLGTYDGAPESTDYMEWGVEIGAEVRQYETDLENALRAAAEQMYGERSWDTHYDGADAPDFELYFGLMKDCLLSYGLLSDTPAERYQVGWLEDLDIEAMDRVFYLEAQVTIPAGGSVTVEAQMIKDGSCDFSAMGEEDKDVYGYDLVTALGANLDFTAQTARAVNTKGVEIVRQNFGFDWESGVETVALDPAVEHYYLEVRRIEET